MKMVLKVEGMHCRSCEMLIDDALDDIGVKSKSSNAAATVEVEYDENKVSREDVVKAIENEGYRVLQ